MDITDARNDRFNLGIQRFLLGDPIEYHGVSFYMTPTKKMNIDSYSAWAPEVTTVTHAKEQIALSKALLDDLARKSIEFRNATNNLSLEFSLCHNYGMGSIVIAKEVNNEFQWLASSSAR